MLQDPLLLPFHSEEFQKALYRTLQAVFVTLSIVGGLVAGMFAMIAMLLWPNEPATLRNQEEMQDMLRAISTMLTSLNTTLSHCTTPE
jgi:hypothetical protein